MVIQKKTLKTTKKSSPKKKKPVVKNSSLTTKKKNSVTKKKKPVIKKIVKKKTSPTKKIITKSKRNSKPIKKKVVKTKNPTKSVKRKKVNVRVIDGNDIDINNTSNNIDRTVEDFSKKLKSIKVNLENKKEGFSTDNNIEKDKNIFKKIDNTEQEEVEEVNKSFFRFRSFNLYRKIALSFILLTILLLVTVFYFSFSSVKITLTPKIEHISDNLILNVYGNKKGPDSEYAIKGIIEKTEISLEKEYKSTGAEIVDESMVGEVTIINNYNKDQPLIKSTRLLSAEGILYRIKDTVNVPAGGNITVGVYTDEPSRNKQLNPTEFTIPGLWAGLQDKIYAKNDKPIIYKVKSETYIQQLDINNAIKDIKTEVIKKAEEKFDTKNAKNIIVYKIKNDSILVNSDAVAGDKSKNFKVGGSILVEVVAFGSSNIIDIAERKLSLSMPSDKILSRFNEKNTKYNLNNFNSQEETASIKVSFSGNIKYKSGANVIDKNKIIGLTKAQLEGYLQGLDSFSDFKIQFSPSFIKKVPNLIDKININIK